MEENKNKVYKKVSEVCFYDFLLLETLCSFGSFVLVINILFLEKYIRWSKWNGDCIREENKSIKTACI